MERYDFRIIVIRYNFSNLKKDKRLNNMGKKNSKKKISSYAESIRKLKEAWGNEPVEFIGGIRLNHKKKKKEEG